MNGQKTVIILSFAVLFQTALTIGKSRPKTSARTEPNDPDERRIYDLIDQTLAPCWRYPYGLHLPYFEVLVQFYTRERQGNFSMAAIPIPMTNDNDTDRFVNQIVPVIQLKQRTDRTIVFIIHGYLQDGNERWIRYLRKGLLDKMDITVGIINWSSRSILCTYSDSAFFAQDVAVRIADGLGFMMRSHNIATHKIYMIGHGLGAHIAGQIGKNLPSWHPKIYRITGLDPSYSRIEKNSHLEFIPPNRRLAPTDAEYVDVIHTSKKIGMPDERLGHVDFMMYPALNRSECSYDPTPSEKSRIRSKFNFTWTDLCSHQNAYHYFYEAVTDRFNCKIIGCKTMERAKKIRTKDFNPNQDSVLGLHTFDYVRNSNEVQVLYAFVNEFSPYCRLEQDD